MVRLPLLFAALPLLLAASVTVEVLGRDGARAAVVDVPLPSGAPLRADAIMHSLRPEQLAWKFTRLSDGKGGEIPVVTELAGLKSQLPATAWTLTHVRAGGGGERDDAGMLDVLAGDGDTLRWRLWGLAELAKARRERATPTPPPAPAAPAAEEDEDEDDAAALQRERSSKRAEEQRKPREVRVVEEEGGAGAARGAGAAAGGGAEAEEEEEEEGDAGGGDDL